MSVNSTMDNILFAEFYNLGRSKVIELVQVYGQNNSYFSNITEASKQFKRNQLYKKLAEINHRYLCCIKASEIDDVVNLAQRLEDSYKVKCEGYLKIKELSRQFRVFSKFVHSLTADLTDTPARNTPEATIGRLIEWYTLLRSRKSNTRLPMVKWFSSKIITDLETAVKSQSSTLTLEQAKKLLSLCRMFMTMYPKRARFGQDLRNCEQELIVINGRLRGIM